MSAMPTPTLGRTTFRTSRLLDFCSRKELIAQTGHHEVTWPCVKGRDRRAGRLMRSTELPRAWPRKETGMSNTQLSSNPDEIAIEDAPTTGREDSRKGDPDRNVRVGGIRTRERTGPATEATCPTCGGQEHERRLLEWGRDKPFRDLIQFDGFAAHPGSLDDWIRVDEEGYAVMWIASCDPRRTATVDWIPVRVQIAWETQTQTVLDLLDRIRGCVARGALDRFRDPAAQSAAEDIDHPPNLPF